MNGIEWSLNFVKNKRRNNTKGNSRSAPWVPDQFPDFLSRLARFLIFICTFEW